MNLIKLSNNIATVNGREVPLTNQESSLLKALMDNNGATVSRDSLLKSAWGFQSAGITRTVDVHIQRLRRKLGIDSIATVHKCGYRLNALSIA